MLHTEEQTLQSLWRSECRGCRDERTRAQWPRGDLMPGAARNQIYMGDDTFSSGLRTEHSGPSGRAVRGVGEAFMWWTDSEARHKCTHTTVPGTRVPGTSIPGTRVPTQEVFRVWGPRTWDWKMGQEKAMALVGPWVIEDGPLEIGTQRKEQVCGWMMRSVGGSVHQDNIPVDVGSARVLGWQRPGLLQLKCIHLTLDTLLKHQFLLVGPRSLHF